MKKRNVGRPRKKTARKVGRPKKKIDYDQLESLATLGCTDEEIAVVFNISRSLVEQRKNTDEEFLHRYKKGKTNLKLSLRRSLLKSAFNGNIAAQIFLSKNLLGYRDNPEPEINKRDTEMVIQLSGGRLLSVPPGSSVSDGQVVDI